MTNTQHTKGLWFYSDDMQGPDGKAQIGVREANGLPVAFLGSYKEAKANARLIAAAPELLEALERASRFISASDHGMTKCEQSLVDYLNSVISKARGQSC